MAANQPKPQISPSIVQIAERAEVILRGKGKLHSNDFSAFWSSLTSSESVDGYIICLLCHLYSIQLKNPSPPSVLSLLKSLYRGKEPDRKFKESADIPVFITAENRKMKNHILLTLYYLFLFFHDREEVTSASTCLSRIVVFAIKLFSKDLGVHRPNEDGIFYLELMRMFLTPKYKRDNLSFILEQSCFIDFKETTNIDDIGARNLASSVTEFYIRGLLVEKENAEKVFALLLKFLANPAVSPSDLSSLLHWVRVFLHSTPYVPRGLLDRAEKLIRRYFLWPMPHCTLCIETLRAILREKKAPGIHFLNQTMKECPLLNPEQSRSSGIERKAHLIIDRGCEGGTTMMDILKSFIPTRKANVDIMVGFLHTFLYNELHVELPIHKLSEENIIRFYKALVRIWQAALRIPDFKKADAYRKEKLGKIKEAILKSDIDGSSELGGATTPTNQPMDITVHLISCDTTLIQTNHYGTSANYPTRSNSMSALKKILDTYDAAKKEGERPRVKIAICGDDLTFHNITGAYVCLSLANPELFKNLDVRFYLLPLNDCFLGSFISSEDRWYYRYVSCLISSILNIYPSPGSPPPLIRKAKQEEDFGSAVPSRLGLIATNDDSKDIEFLTELSARVKRESRGLRPQYIVHSNASAPEEHVNLGPKTPSLRRATRGLRKEKRRTPPPPKRSPPGAPATGDAKKVEKGKEDDNFKKKHHPPGSLLRHGVENYFRDARWPLNIRVYNCECWKEGGGKSITIPFCQKVELGVLAYAAFLKDNDDNKNWKFSSPSLHITYTSRTMGNYSRHDSPVLDFRPYMRVLISAVGWPGDPGVKAHPRRTWLELYLQEGEFKRKRRKTDMNEFLPSFSDLGDPRRGKSYRVAQIAIKSQSGFHMLLDSVPYGPFVQLNITPSYDREVSGKRQFSLPIMTFSVPLPR